MFGKYLNQKDKEEMIKWRTLIENKSFELTAIREAFNIWFYKKLDKYGTDKTKLWTLDIQTGQIKEVKQEPKQNA